MPFISSFLPGAQAWGVGLEGGGRNTTHKPTSAQSFELRDCRRETTWRGGWVDVLGGAGKDQESQRQEVNDTSLSKQVVTKNNTASSFVPIRYFN